MKFGDIIKPSAPTVEAGTYLAVCVGFVTIGTQYVPPYGDRKAGRYEDRALFIWDIPSEMDENGAPKQLSKQINLTYSAKGNLMAILSSWNSRTYTKDELKSSEAYDQIGKPCMLTVTVNENGYANVTTVSAVPKGIQVPASQTPPIKFGIKEWSDEGFSALPEWIQNKIRNSSEYKKLHAPETTVDFPDTASAQESPRQPSAGPPPFNKGGSSEVNPI